MRLLVLGLNWIASPQSLIDTCVPQFIMISNEKIIHRGHPIANSICGLEAALSTLWFPREFRGQGGMRQQHAGRCGRPIVSSQPQSDDGSTSSPRFNWCLPFQLDSVVVYLHGAIRPYTRNKLEPCTPELSKHLPGSEVRGLKWLYALEKRNPRRSIYKIRKPGIEEAQDLKRQISLTLLEKDLHPKTGRVWDVLSKWSITLAEDVAALLKFTYFPTTAEKQQKDV